LDSDWQAKRLSRANAPGSLALLLLRLQVAAVALKVFEFSTSSASSQEIVAVKVHGTHALPADRDHVWAMLMDPEVLVRCLPGCEKLVPAGENYYTAVIRIKLMPIRGNYTGALSMSDLDPPHSYKLIMEGKGSPGFVRSTASVRLAEKGGFTDLHYTGESVIGGAIGAMGGGTLVRMTNSLISRFFEAFEQEILSNPGSN
jgi:carbon monoxide dehydrogenase subunit G